MGDYVSFQIVEPESTYREQGFCLFKILMYMEIFLLQYNVLSFLI